MEDQNKRDYSDFFKSREEEERNNGRGQSEERPSETANGQRPSYYYSYGPYKSQQEESEHAPESQADTTFVSSEGVSSVEVSTPRPVRPYAYEAPQLFDSTGTGAPSSSQEGEPRGGWNVNQRRRSSGRSIFAAFLAGTVIMGSLMFASDRMNLFSGGSQTASNTATATASNGNGSSVPVNSNVKPASMDVVGTNAVSKIFQQSSPAVVKIDTYVNTQQRSSSNSLKNDPFFQYFFGDDGQSQGTQPKTDSKQEQGLGTGFLFEKSGYILTNEHVIDGADEIEVTVQGYDKPFKATLLGNSFDLDLAVLKIEGTKDFPTLPLGDSSQTNIGDWVVAIGNPYGFDHTVTVGVLSASEREISIPENNGTRNYKHLLQTDASINPGNSGGPLLNMNGEVIGINTAVNASAQGIGFAIPTSTISEVLDQLKNNVKIPLPYIGASLVSLKDIDATTLSQLNIDTKDGALVEDVLLGTPAFKAGLRKYDIITTADNAAVKTKEELIAKIQAKKPGNTVTLGVLRDGKKQDITITVGDRNDYVQQQQKKQ